MSIWAYNNVNKTGFVYVNLQVNKQKASIFKVRQFEWMSQSKQIGNMKISFIFWFRLTFQSNSQQEGEEKIKLFYIKGKKRNE
jgi:hypothetical protein